MAWRPILDGVLAEAALGAVRDIANALATNPRAATPTDRTLFWAYASGVLDEPFADAAYNAAVDDLVVELQAGVPHPALFGGLAGMGWTLAHVLDGDADQVCAPIDEVLVRSLAAGPWTDSFDLMTGLVGFGVYFLERSGSGSEVAREGLSLVTDQLAACAHCTDAGAAWFTPRHQLPAQALERWPNGLHNCGLAHGSPGVIALLARMPDRYSRALADKGVRWLVSQRMDPHERGRFPSSTEEAPKRARAAWCYGEPGIACALHAAAPDLALETARDMAARTEETAGCIDAGLCHGTAGLAHITNRWYQATDDEAFAASARTWFARTLDMRSPSGFGGIESWGPDGMTPDANWLEGAIGVALALLGATGTVEPAWDRRLLCDLPSDVARDCR